jgi:cell division protein FtsL
VRSFSAIGVVLLVCVSFGLYYGVLRTKAQTRELEAVARAIAREEETIRVLRAEWSYLTQPERLQALARRHLKLTPPGPSQIAELGDLPFRKGAGAAMAGFAPAPRSAGRTPRHSPQLVGMAQQR